MLLNVSRRSFGVISSSQLFSGIYLFSLLGGFSIFRANEEGATSISAFIFAFLYILTPMYLAKALKQRFAYRHLQWILMINGGLLASSILSYNPTSSIAASISLICNFGFAFYLAITFSIDSFFVLVHRVLVSMTAIAVAIGIFDIDLILYVDLLDRTNILGLPNIKGIFPHKIHAGVYWAFGAAVSVWLYYLIQKLYYILTAIAFFILVALSGSSLAIVVIAIATAISLATFLLRTWLGTGATVIFQVTLLPILFYITFLSLTPQLLLSIGRDATLTGRTDIWLFGLTYIQSNPWIGSGFGVFFSDDARSPAQELWATMEWYRPPSFHNGYLEILAEVGAIGAAPYLFMLLFAIWKSIKECHMGATGVLIVIVLSNFGASLFVKPNLFSFVCVSYLFLTFLFQRPSSHRGRSI
jgi:exopolysaccharide production protein ExoQ